MEMSEASLDGASDWTPPYEFDEDGYDYYDVPDATSDDVNYLDDEVVSSRRRVPWDIITPENIQQHQNDMLAEVSEVLACPQSSARMLLIDYGWDKTQLINEFVEKGKEAVFLRAGCPLDDTPTPLSEGALICECCFCTMERDACSSTGCGHWFCNDCWVGYFDVQIRDGNSCRLKCMGFKCGYSCSEEMVLKLLDNPSEVRERYQLALLESYVDDNASVKWCPSIPNCGNAVRSNRDDCCEPTCTCGLQFCFSCLAEAHSPCSCEMWAAWERKRMDESETINWITANTKPCPKCGKPVEKNGGCNLMTCRCGQHFCWLCGGSTGFDHTYHTISNHQCGRWKQDMERDIDAAASNHKRYMHYFSRWNGHRDSLNKELANKDNVVAYLQGLRDSLHEHAYEYDALSSAVKVLTVSRKVLSNSYAFAFFLCGNDWYVNEVQPEMTSLNQALFEDMQQQFEEEIERLSKFLSMTDLETDDQKAHLANVLNCSRTVLRRMQNFFEAINSGLLGQLEQSVVSIADFMPYDLLI